MSNVCGLYTYAKLKVIHGHFSHDSSEFFNNKIKCKLYLKKIQGGQILQAINPIIIFFINRIFFIAYTLMAFLFFLLT